MEKCVLGGRAAALAFVGEGAAHGVLIEREYSADEPARTAPREFTGGAVAFVSIPQAYAEFSAFIVASFLAPQRQRSRRSANQRTMLQTTPRHSSLSDCRTAVSQ